MKTYKLKLRPLSSIASPLHSDTIFGAFCWAYRYLEGEEALISFLKLFCEGKPPIVFSNAFFENSFPIPSMGFNYKERQKELTSKERLEQMKNRKVLKRIDSMDLETFNCFISGGNYLSLIQKKAKEKNPFMIKEKSIITQGNMVNRLYGTVAHEDGFSGLFERRESFSCQDYQLFVKIKEEYENIAMKVLKLAFSMGIGADKSVGKGLFDVLEWEVFNGFSDANNPNAFITLSNMIPAKNDPIKGSYKTIVKYGKLDREFACSDKPFKKPLLILTEGAVFFDNMIKEFYGRVVKNVSHLNKNIIHNGYAFVVPCRIMQ